MAAWNRFRTHGWYVRVFLATVLLCLLVAICSPITFAGGFAAVRAQSSDGATSGKSSVSDRIHSLEADLAGCSYFNEDFSTVVTGKWTVDQGASGDSWTIGGGTLNAQTVVSDFTAVSAAFSPSGIFTVDVDVKVTTLPSGGFYGIYPYQTSGGDVFLTINGKIVDGFGGVVFSNNTARLLAWDLQNDEFIVSNLITLSAPVSSVGVKLQEGTITLRINKQDTGSVFTGSFSLFPMLLNRLQLLTGKAGTQISFDNVCADPAVATATTTTITTSTLRTTTTTTTSSTIRTTTTTTTTTSTLRPTTTTSTTTTTLRPSTTTTTTTLSPTGRVTVYLNCPAKVAPNASLSLPVRVEVGTGISLAALQMDLLFNSSHLSFVSVARGEAAALAEKDVTSREVSPGRIRFVIAGLNSKAVGSGILMTVSLKLASGVASGTSVALQGDQLSASNFVPQTVPSSFGGGCSMLVSSTCGCDVNADGMVNVVDVMTVVNMILGVIPATCDIDGDGQVNVNDVMFVVNAILNNRCDIPSTGGQTATKTISSGSGDVVVTQDGYAVFVPSGAVPTNSSGAEGRMPISVETGVDPPVPLPSGVQLIGKIVKYGPDGFNFAGTLQCALPVPAGTVKSEMTALRFDPSLNKWGRVPFSFHDENPTEIVITDSTLGYLAAARVPPTVSRTEAEDDLFAKQSADASGALIWRSDTCPGGSGSCWYSISMLTAPTPPAGWYGTFPAGGWWGVGSDPTGSWPRVPSIWIMPQGTYQMCLMAREGPVIAGQRRSWTYSKPVSVTVGQPYICNFSDCRYTTDFPSLPADGSWGQGACPVPDPTITYGTGEFQATLTWINAQDATTDVDLHLYGPNNLHVYYGHKVDTAFQLDVDWRYAVGNATENLFSTATIPNGSYQVQVHHYGGTLPKSYNVRITYKNVTRTFTGTLTTYKEQKTILEFTYP